MNLFNYLMNKKDKKIVDSDHLLEYLLNRGRLASETGTTISIDTQKTKINKLILSKESTQATSTYKGLLKIPESLSRTINGLTFVVNDDNSVTVTGTSTINTQIDLQLETPLLLNGTYTFSLKTVGTISHAQQQQWILYPQTNLNPTVESNKTNKVTRTLTNLTINTLRVYTTANRTLNCTIYPILEEGDTATEWSEMPTNTTPNTTYPQEVKTVKGYKNLFDKNSNGIEIGWIVTDGSVNGNGQYNQKTSDFIEVKPNVVYKISNPNVNNPYAFYDQNKQMVSGTRANFTESGEVIATNTNVKYLRFTFINSRIDEIMMVEGNNTLPYVPYGTNWIYTTVSNGTDTNYYTIPLNENEIVGKLTVLDELIIDKNGHCWLNKKFNKINSYDGEVITTDYWSTTGGLDTGATIYYVLEEPELIDLDIDIDIELFKGSNTITNSASANMKLYYYE